jgi:dTDP-4-dehydrorhamnose 3,5-epimerase
MHYQRDPAPEPKVVRCLRGAIFDVAVDLRRGSSTFCAWFGVNLTADNQRALYMPPGCAHGFLTLADDTEVGYLMGAFYDPALASGVRWDDPAFAIAWPFPPVVISPRDAGYPDCQP